jgi:hypothetical protein
MLQEKADTAAMHITFFAWLKSQNILKCYFCIEVSSSLYVIYWMSGPISLALELFVLIGSLLN